MNLEMTNWRAIAAPPGISDSERARIAGWVTRVMKTPKWQENLKRNDWTPFVKTGADLDRFITSEQKRVHSWSCAVVDLRRVPPGHGAGRHG